MNFNIPIGENIIELDSVDSTNNYLSKLINETDVPNGTVILAHNQTKGKGQRGNTWLTEKGKNIACSYLIKPQKLEIQNVFLISMAVANAIHKCLVNYTENIEIKWPNDILINNKKICGILIENNIAGKYISQSIVGIGININQEIFPQEINATSLVLEENKNYDVKDVLNELNKHLTNEINLLNNGFYLPIKNYYLNNLIGYKKKRKFIDLTSNTTFIGEIKEVENNGLLIVENDKNHNKFSFKEIQFVL